MSIREWAESVGIVVPGETLTMEDKRAMVELSKQYRPREDAEPAGTSEQK